MKAFIMLYKDENGSVKVYNEGVFKTEQCAIDSVSPLEATSVYGPFKINLPAEAKGWLEKFTPVNGVAKLEQAA